MELNAAQLTHRWDVLQEARLKEMSEIVLSSETGSQRLALIEALNNDPFWESLFDRLETQLGKIEPDHPYLVGNQIPV